MVAQGRVETATVMFTDMVGSTALRARVGEDEAERLRLVHDTIVSTAAETHEGIVVKHLGDGAMAAFTGRPRPSREILDDATELTASRRRLARLDEAGATSS